MQRADVRGPRGEAAGHARGALAPSRVATASSSSASPPAFALHALSRWLGGHRKLVRCMPNTPALIGAGIAGLYALPEVSAEESKRRKPSSRAVGEAVWVADERLLDPVTAVSASGPAYVFWFIEQLAASGEKLGIPPRCRVKLAMQTVLGAAKLAAASSESPAQLRKNVTSKGGTTEAALKVFEQEQLAERFRQARSKPPAGAAPSLATSSAKTSSGRTRCSRRSPSSWSTRSSRSSCSCCSALPFPVAARAVPQPGGRVRARDHQLDGDVRCAASSPGWPAWISRRCCSRGCCRAGLWLQAAILGADPGSPRSPRSPRVDLRALQPLHPGVRGDRAGASRGSIPTRRSRRCSTRSMRPFLRPLRRFVPPVGQHRPHAAGACSSSAGGADSARRTCASRRRHLILELHVQPGAKRSEFAGKHGERIKLRLAAPRGRWQGQRRADRVPGGLFRRAEAKRAHRLGCQVPQKRVAIEESTNGRCPEVSR